MPTITATEARIRFADMMKDAENEVIQITQRNKPTAAILSWEAYESLLETLEILSDPDLMEQIGIGERQAAAGKLIDWDDIKHDLEQ